MPFLYPKVVYVLRNPGEGQLVNFQLPLMTDYLFLIVVKWFVLLLIDSYTNFPLTPIIVMLPWLQYRE